ncbi:U2 small nuclear ribonucleoprotein A'-like [Panonychus citri]|uniref:U2 small nuclear ribonucleoprotein A'-like n=1 Tax=Panonychus citri TaxID=50023 RepID=UPI002306DF9D|nr:U2 small nuclear ribonucleoprotein A'-like [Panonychus citri]
MKLTVDIVANARQYINPATKDRELDLRDYKISVIENLGACLDQFDCIDFTDNNIRRLDGFPLLLRLKKILISNNRINRIANDLDSCLPNLEWLILTNNSLGELGDIDGLSCLPKLECLCLLNNPLTTKKYYRQYVIHKLPKLKILDFCKIKRKEREESASLFKGGKGKQLAREIGIKSKTFITSNSNSTTSSTITTNNNNNIETNRSTTNQHGKPIHTPADVEAIKAAIAKAKTLEEIERLNQLLKAGYIPGRALTSGDVTMTSESEKDSDDHDAN